MSKCLKCHSNDTRLERGDDGHFRKYCDDCGHVGGPYVSSYTDDSAESDFESEPSVEQASLGDF
jgi:hypothetical protein